MIFSAIKELGQTVFKRHKRIDRLLDKMEYVQDRMDGIESFSQTIQDMKTKIAVLTSSMNDLKYVQNNIQRTVDTLFNLFDRRTGMSDSRILKIDRRCRD